MGDVPNGAGPPPASAGSAAGDGSRARARVGAPGGAGAGEQVLLAPYTTLGLGGPARRFAEAASADDIVAQVRAADDIGEPLLVLGGGSNLVIPDEGFPGTVVRVRAGGVRRARAGGGAVDVTVTAGENWDGVVASCVSGDLAGLECLSGIPGVAGATPIQNVSAYGQEVAETVTVVRAYDRRQRRIVDLTAAECGFGYRDSMFKRRPAGMPVAGRRGAAGAAGRAAGTGAARQASGGPAGDGAGGIPFARATGRFVVLSVTFRLTPGQLSLPVRYRELAAAIDVPEGGRARLGDVRAAVLALRRAKGMVLDPQDTETRSAGSFFTNPVLRREQFAALARAVAATCGDGVSIPHFAAADGGVKVPAAWLIERAGFGKGYPGGTGPRISARHTLALVNPGGATTAGLLGLARQIRDGVRDTFGVELVAEPVLVGAVL